MLMYQKTMFDRCCCIKSFCHLKTLEKRFEKKVYFGITDNRVQKHEGVVRLKKAYSRAKTYMYVIWTSLNYVHFYARYNDVNFL